VEVDGKLDVLSMYCCYPLSFRSLWEVLCSRKAQILNLLRTRADLHVDRALGLRCHQLGRYVSAENVACNSGLFDLAGSHHLPVPYIRQVFVLQSIIRLHAYLAHTTDFSL